MGGAVGVGAGGAQAGGPGRLDRLDGSATGATAGAGGAKPTVSGVVENAHGKLGFPFPGPGGKGIAGALARGSRLPSGFGGEFYGHRTVCGHLLQSGRMGTVRADQGFWPAPGRLLSIPRPTEETLAQAVEPQLPADFAVHGSTGLLSERGQRAKPRAGSAVEKAANRLLASVDARERGRSPCGQSEVSLLFAPDAGGYGTIRGTKTPRRDPALRAVFDPYPTGLAGLASEKEHLLTLCAQLLGPLQPVAPVSIRMHLPRRSRSGCNVTTEPFRAPWP